MEPKGSSLTPFLTVQLAMGKPFSLLFLFIFYFFVSMDGLRKHSSHLSEAQFLEFLVSIRGTVIKVPGVSLSELHTNY